MAHETFQLQVLSDVHLEFYTTETPPEIPKVAPFVALLGDVGYPKDLNYQKFVLRLAEKFQKVFILAGNHEYYGTTREESNKLIEQLCLDRKNIIFLNKSTYTEGNVKIIGCTLWSWIPEQNAKAVQATCNDYKNIYVEEKGKLRLLTIEDQNQWHKQELQWLTEELIQAKTKKQSVIVLTHHAPTDQHCIAPQATQATSCIDFTDLEYLIEPPIVVWAFGHTHHNCDFKFNNVRLVTNQLGTLPEGLLKTFKSDKVIEFPIASQALNVSTNGTEEISEEQMKEASNLIDILLRKPEKEPKKRKYFEAKKGKESKKQTLESQVEQQVKYNDDDELESFLSSNPPPTTTLQTAVESDVKADTKPEKKKMTFKF